MAMGETIYHNARVWTGLDSPRFVSSFRVDGGRIVELDCEHEEVSCESVDLGGRFISPGLIDAHLHLLSGGESLMQVDLSTVSSREEFQDVLAEAHEELAPDRWLIASGWSENRWESRQVPDKSWLACCGTRPVVCWRMDLHTAVVNDAVLDHLSLPDDETLEAEGGRVHRDDDGGMTGVLQEAAAWYHLIPALPDLPIEDRRVALQSAHQHCLRLGLTSVRSMEYSEDVQSLHMKRSESGSLRVSIVLLDRTLPLSLDWLQDARRDEWFRITGCKSFLDGTLGSRTARLEQPYADAAGNQGVFTEHLLEGTLAQWAQEVVAGGCAPVMHAIGDSAILAGLEIARTVGADIRTSVEHVEVVTDQVLLDLDRLPGVRLSVQPLHRADDAVFAESALGPERAAGLLPLASLIKRGARLSFGSDWPVVSVDPLEGMAAAITGHDVRGTAFHPEQVIGVEDALQGYSVHAAEVAGLDHVGSLGIGQTADFIAWSEDPFKFDWTQGKPSIVATFMAGELVEGTLQGAEAI